MIHTYKRGHKAVYNPQEEFWVYQDTLQPMSVERPCIMCGEMPTKEGYDACLGHIDGVSHACCGHGVEKSYSLFNEETGV